VAAPLPHVEDPYEIRASGIAAMHTLYYSDEVRRIERQGTLPKAADQEVKFAEQYIEALAKDFDPEQYRDTYRDTLLAVIRAKAEGLEIRVAEAAPAPPKSSNLMEALRQSVEQVRKPPAKAETPTSRPAARVTRLDERKRATARRRRSG
jgi:DNA end-binding protein Ku